MKRFIVTILALLYFTVSSGMVMNIHYCMGKIRSVKLQATAKKMCGCKKQQEKKSCCKTEHKLIKVQDSHKASAAGIDIAAPVALLPEQPFQVYTPAATIVRLHSVNNNSPPGTGTDIYLRNCVFRI
jgi:hypothetical protein